MKLFLGQNDFYKFGYTYCISTKELYDCIKIYMSENNIAINDLWKTKRTKFDINSITPDVVEIDEDNFFYNRHVVFTGKRENTFFDVQCSCTICTFRLRKNSISSHTKNLLCEQDFVISLHYMNWDFRVSFFYETWLTSTAVKD